MQERTQRPAVRPKAGASWLLRARRTVAAELASAAASRHEEGMPNLRIHGQLLRPVVAYAVARELECERDPSLWCGALAIQLAHEASLIHDDIVDDAATRRGARTRVAEVGPHRALIEGDHLLTSAYRMAAACESVRFGIVFARAVERTVAGECMQAAATGRMGTPEAYSRTVRAKTGGLFACAAAAAPLLAERVDADAFFALGERIGETYQMLDDFLDYLPHAGTGKPPMKDLAGGHWTWILSEAPTLSLGAPPEVVRQTLSAGRPSVILRCLSRFDRRCREIAQESRGLLPHDPILIALIDQWRRVAWRAAQRTRFGTMCRWRVWSGPAAESRIACRSPEADPTRASDSTTQRTGKRLHPHAGRRMEPASASPQSGPAGAGSICTFDRLLLTALAPSQRAVPAQFTAAFTTSDWNGFFERAQSHEVAPLLYERIRRADVIPRVPAAFVARLAEEHAGIQTTNTARLRELDALIDKLSADRIPLVALKGSHLARVVYGDPALRPMADIDVLAQVADLERVQEALLELGYGPRNRASIESVCEWNCHLPPFDREGASRIEVHWNIELPQSPFPINPSDLWSRVHCAEGGVLGLGAEDLMIHLCLHVSFHHGFEVELKHIADIAYMAHRLGTHLDWDVLARRANEWRAGRLVRTTLQVTETLLGPCIPEHAMRGMVHDPTDEAMVSIVCLHILKQKHRPRPAPGEERTNYLITRWLQGITRMEERGGFEAPLARAVARTPS